MCRPAGGCVDVITLSKPQRETSKLNEVQRMGKNRAFARRFCHRQLTDIFLFSYLFSVFSETAVEGIFFRNSWEVIARKILRFILETYNTSFLI